MPSKPTRKRTRSEKARADTRRSQRPARAQRRRRSSGKNYEVVAVSLFPTEHEPLLKITKDLRRLNPTINRSLVVRWALSRLARELRGKGPSELHQAYINWLQEEATNSTGRTTS